MSPNESVQGSWRRAVTAGRLRWISGVVMALACCSAALVGASEGGHGEPGVLTINWWDWGGHAPPMGYFLIDFVLFVGGLVYVAAKPLSQAFAQRHITIKRAIADTASAHAKAEAKHREFRDKLSAAEAEIAALVKTSEADGGAERAQIIREAQDYADRMRQDLGSLAAQELQRAQLRLRRTVLQSALVKARRVLSQEMSEADRQRLLEQSIAELESGDVGVAVRRGKANTSRASESGGRA